MANYRNTQNGAKNAAFLNCSSAINVGKGEGVAGHSNSLCRTHSEHIRIYDGEMNKSGLSTKTKRICTINARVLISKRLKSHWNSSFFFCKEDGLECGRELGCAETIIMQ